MRYVIFALAMFSFVRCMADNARFTLCAVDERTAIPLPEMKVKAVFVDRFLRWENATVDHEIDGCTDLNGRYAATGNTNCGKLGFCFRDNDGFYDTIFAWVPFDANGSKPLPLLQWWKPDDQVITVKLQRVEHPIPLFVKKISDRNYPYGGRVFDKGDGVLEFDFLVGDWLPPAGRGKVADVRFERLPQKDMGQGMNASGMKGRVYRDSMSVRFLGADNGLIEVPHSLSAGLRIRMAPESGYLPTYSCWRGVGPDLQLASSYKEDRDFCFRIRTQRNEKGEIVAAHYGKIYGDISFAPAMNPFQAVASVCMVYYLNPKPLDRNLEWDMKTNLCPTPGELGQRQP